MWCPSKNKQAIKINRPISSFFMSIVKDILHELPKAQLLGSWTTGSSFLPGKKVHWGRDKPTKDIGFLRKATSPHMSRQRHALRKLSLQAIRKEGEVMAPTSSWESMLPKRLIFTFSRIWSKIFRALWNVYPEPLKVKSCSALSFEGHTFFIIMSRKVLRTFTGTKTLKESSDLPCHSLHS